MFNLFKRAFAQPTQSNPFQEFLDHGEQFLSDDEKREREANRQRLARRNALAQQRVDQAMEFLTAGFTQLAEEQRKGLKRAEPGDYTVLNVTEFERKSSMVMRLVVRQADTLFGTMIVNKALDALDHDCYRFRMKHGCT